MTLIQLRRAQAPANTLSDLRFAVITRGACRNAPDPDAWFPDEPAPTGDPALDLIERAVHEEHARTLCDGCPVRALCLELALHEERNLQRSEIHGVRGGKTARQRWNIRRGRRQAAVRQARKAA
ncbi:WhiB family transcriptional regulator [Acrocarpospora catenulata]|uniref:WhiB family transcriptional regulator n=1 Tax=Acrocarpospora catenulata TaxID=2836182 RepID=UPI001BDA4EEE|nr:WhiB family transcriptional regulator [Acrocarpospora catenulata]